MVTFPVNPQINDTYTASGKTWKWSGTVWQLQPRTLTSADITDFSTAAAAAAPATTDASLLTTGTLADARLSANVVLTGDARLSNARTPTAHASTHGESGADPVVMTSAFTVKAVSQGSYNDGNVIPAGTSLETIIKNMLRQRVAAVYTSPTLSLGTSATLNPEIGTNISASLVPAWSQNSAGAATAFRVKRDGTTVQTTSGSTPANYSAVFQLLASTSFTAEADYQAGPQQYDNLGDISGTPLPSGTAVSSALTFTPRRATFYGADTSGSAAATSAAVRSLASSVLGHANGSTFTLSIPAGTTRLTIAYPATLRTLSSVKYVEVGNSEVKDTFTETSVSVEGANAASPTSYRVFTYIPSIPFGSAATYTVTI